MTFTHYHRTRRTHRSAAAGQLPSEVVLRHRLLTMTDTGHRGQGWRLGWTGLGWAGLSRVELGWTGGGAGLQMCQLLCPPVPVPVPVSAALGWWMVGAQCLYPLACLPIGPTACPLDRSEQMSSVNSVKNYKTHRANDAARARRKACVCGRWKARDVKQKMACFFSFNQFLPKLKFDRWCLNLLI